MDKQFYEYSDKFGQLFLNLLAIEFLLRTCIFKKEQSKEEEEMRKGGKTDLEIGEYRNFLEAGMKKLFNSVEGERVKRNSLTEDNSFRNVIEKFNSYSDIEYKIDCDKLAKLRNSLAHGRITFEDMKEPPKLLNFKKNKENEGEMLILDSKVLNESFFEHNLKYSLEVLESLHNLLDRYFD